MFIDTLSFERYEEGEPWVAYRQFGQHFLAPLALLAYVDIQLGNLQRLHIDGIPLDLAARLLPRRTRWKPSLFLHLHMHSWSQKRVTKSTAKASSKKKFGPNAMRGLIDNLQSTVKRLKPHQQNTTWEAYYGNTNYSSSAEQHKVELIEQFVTETQPATVWDLGANSGKFSEIAARQAEHVVAFDYDPLCVEQLCQKPSDKVLALIMDLSNPSPSLGWRHQERSSLSDRGPADTAMALALVHHLAIGNNVPLPEIASWMADLTRHLIIEFVPKSDSQVQHMLSTRHDVFPNYTQAAFESAFEDHFSILKAISIRECERTLYLMEKKGS